MSAKTFKIYCDGGFSEGNLYGISVYEFDYSEKDKILNKLTSADFVNTEVIEKLPLKPLRDYYGFKNPNKVKITLDEKPVKFKIEKIEKDFSTELEKDGILVQEFPLSGTICFEANSEKDITFLEQEMKYFPENNLITSVKIGSDIFDFNDYMDGHTYFQDLFFAIELKKSTAKIKELVVLPDGRAVDMWDTSHWNLGAFTIIHEEELGFEDYIHSIERLINALSDSPIAFLQNTEQFLEVKKLEWKENEGDLEECHLFFAFPGKAEKCAEVMKLKSGEADYYDYEAFDFVNTYLLTKYIKPA